MVKKTPKDPHGKRGSEEHYRSLFAELPDAVLIHDADGVILEANESMARRLEVPREALVGRNLAEFVASANVDAIAANVAKAMAGQPQVFETTYLSASGKAIPAEVREQPIAWGAGHALLSVSRDISDRKRAEAALRESEARYRRITEGLTDYQYTVRVENGRAVETVQSPACAVVTGYTAEEFAADPYLWFRMVVPEDREPVRTRVQQVLAGTEIPPIEHRILRKDGETRWVNDTTILRKDADGKLLSYDGVVKDITDRKQAELERETTVKLLRLLNTDNNSHELIKTVLVFLKDWSGYEAVGIRLRDGDDYPYFEVQGFSEEFAQLENQLCTRDLHGQVVRDSVGNPVLECMCGNILCGRFDPSKPFFTANGSFWSNCTTELLASTTDADRQTRTRNRCNGEGYESVALIALRSGGTVFGLIQLNDHRKGMFTPALISLVERLADNIAQALAERLARKALRESEERLRQMQKMDAIGQLAGGVAHDFNNQLTAVLGYAELLVHRLDDSNLKRYASNIYTAAQRSADLTRKLLAFARKGQYQSIPVDMHHVIAEAVEMLQHSIDKRIRVEQLLRAQPTVVTGDPSQLVNALLNLGLNARDAMPDGGTLTFETQIVNLDAEFCNRHPHELQPGHFFLLAVTDTGYGMSDEVKQHLFEPFFTTKPIGKGTGMGLLAQVASP